MIPRVTQILADLGLSPNYAKILPAEKLERLRQRGTALHAAFQWLEAGTLDEATVHEELRPGLNAYRAWRRDVRHEPIASEIELVHPEWGFMGHPDRIGTVHGEPSLIDWKFSTSPDLRAGRFQLAGYRLLWNSQRTPLVRDCFLVALSPKDGSYRMHKIPDVEGAEQVVLAATILWRELYSEQGGARPGAEWRGEAGQG